MSVDPYSFDLLNTNWSFLFCQSYCDIFCHTYISIWVLQSCSQSSIWRLKRSAQCARDLVLSLSTHKGLAWPTANDHLLLVFVPILWGCLLSLCLVDMSLEREEEEWSRKAGSCTRRFNAKILTPTIWYSSSVSKMSKANTQSKCLGKPWKNGVQPLRGGLQIC